MTHFSSPAPRVVAWLGYGGLVPFIALAVATVVDPLRAPVWVQAQVAYAAVILSFVGALHWGVAMVVPASARHASLFIWSVVPSLLAWVALLGSQAGYPGLAAVLMVAGFLAHFGMDLRHFRSSSVLPQWYLPLRLRLTTVASLCLLPVVFYGR